MWRNKKLVYVMSTNSQPEGDSTVRRRNRDGTAQQVPCPPSVVAYNQHMGGVDRGDQLRQYYRGKGKTRKSYRYIFWFLFDSCVANSSNPDSKRRILARTPPIPHRPNLARTPPFPILTVGTLLKLLHFRFQTSELGFELLHSRFQVSELGSNFTISDSKRPNLARTPPFPIPGVGTWFELLQFRFQASELGSNSSNSDSKHPNLDRTPQLPIPSIESSLELLQFRFQASELLELCHFRFQAS